MNNLKLYKIIIISFFLIFFSISLSQENYVQGEVRVRLNQNLFKFPLEVYGAFISIEDESRTIKIDSLHFLLGSSYNKDGEIISYEELAESNPELISRISIDFDKEFIYELEKIDTYYIARGIKSFDPKDTLPHYINTRFGRKQVTSPNWNMSLSIKYNNETDAIEVAKKLNNLACIDVAWVNEIFIEEKYEKPSLVHQEIPVLPDSIEADTSSNIVVVTVLIDTLGNAEDVIIFSSRDKRLNPFALNAAKKCKFAPAKRNGKKVKIKMNVKFVFE